MIHSKFSGSSIATAQTAQQPIALPVRPAALSAAFLLFPRVGRFPFDIVNSSVLGNVKQ